MNPSSTIHPDTWSWLADLAMVNRPLASALAAEMHPRNPGGPMQDMGGDNVICRQLAAGIVPEEFRDGSLFWPGMLRKRAGFVTEPVPVPVAVASVVKSTHEQMRLGEK